MARREAEAPRKLGARLDLDDRRDAGHAQFAGKTALAFEPIDLSRDGDGALLDAAVALVEIDIDMGRVAPCVFEEAFNLNVGWLALTARR